VAHGGIESTLIHWCQCFDVSRYDVRIAYLANDRGRDASFVQAATAAGLKIIPVPWSPYKPFLTAAWRVARLVKELNMDVLHTHAYYGDILGAMVGKLTGVKTIATVYVWGSYEFRRLLLQWMDLTALRMFDRVTAHCLDTLEKSVAKGFRRERLALLISGIPPASPALPLDERLNLRRKAGISDDSMLLLNVARLSPEKAHDQLLDSFRQILQRRPRARLWICGDSFGFWQKYRDRLFAQHRRLALESSVSFLGYRSNLTELFAMADLMVHPSHVEGVPIAIISGMAAGLPVVASNVGGISEVIRPGVTGLLVPENGVTEFAEAVVGLLENDGARASLGSAARRFVEMEYSAEAATRRVEQVYDEVVGL
jgi:glycosyltransferase involved in cell wall biosynthesis